MKKLLQQVTASKGSKKLLTGAALLMAFLCQSQSLNFKYLSNIKIPIKSDNGFMNALVISINNDIIYFTTKKPAYGEKRVIIYSYNLKKNSYDSLVISKTKLTKDLFGERRLSLCATEKELIIVSDENIFIFKNSTKSPDLLKKVKNVNYNDIYKLGKDDYMLYVNYDFHPMDAKDKHVWAKLDVEKGEIIHQKKMPDDNVLFSPFVNSWLSTYKGLIAYAQTSTYKVKFYDSNFHVIDSLTSTKLDSNRRHIETLNKLDNRSKDGIYEIKLMEDSLLTRIQKVYLLDSTHVLVMLKLPKQKHYIYETWAKVNNHWELKNSISLPAWYEVNKAYTKSDPLFSSFIGNVDGILYLGKNKFVSIYYPYQEYIDTKAFNKKTDFENPFNELIKKGDTYFGMQEFMIYE